MQKSHIHVCLLQENVISLQLDLRQYGIKSLPEDINRGKINQVCTILQGCLLV